MSKSVNVDFVTRQIEVDTDGKEHFISAAMAAKDAEASMLNAQNAATSVQKYKALWFDSVAAMKAEPSLTAGAYVCTAGYYESNDGGSASYLIRAKADADVDDGGSLHELQNGLVAELIVENGTVCPEQFGAKGDGVSDDTNAIQKAIDFVKTLTLNAKYYLITKTLNVAGHRKIIGTSAGINGSVIKADIGDGYTCAIKLLDDYSSFSHFRLESTRYTYDEKGSNATYNGIQFNQRRYISFDNVYVIGFNTGINIEINSWCNIFNNTTVLQCNVGVYVSSECNSISFVGGSIRGCVNGIHAISGMSINFYGVDIERNTVGALIENVSFLGFSSCYFELNSEGTIKFIWGMNAPLNCTIRDCTFFENTDCQGVFVVHSSYYAKFIVENCYFRSASAVEDTIPIFKKYDNNTKIIPVLKDSTFTAQYSLDENWVNNYSTTPMVYKIADVVTLETATNYVDGFIFKQGNHIWGELVVGYTAVNANTKLFTFNSKFVPTHQQDIICAICDERWGNPTSMGMAILNDLGFTIQGPAGNKFAKFKLNYVQTPLPPS